MFIDPTTITLSELTTQLNHKDNRATKRWLKEKNIFLHTRGKEKYIFKWHFDLAIQLTIVEELKVTHPTNWHILYALNASNPEITATVLSLHPPKVTVKAQPRKSNQVKFI